MLVLYISLLVTCLYYIKYIILCFLSLIIILIYSIDTLPSSPHPASQDPKLVGMSINISFTLLTCSVTYSI